MSTERAKHPWGAGHSGIALCDSKTGRVTYYDYGRYPPAKNGNGAGRSSIIKVKAVFEESKAGYPILINGKEVADAIKSSRIVNSYSSGPMSSVVINKIDVNASHAYASKDVGKVSDYTLAGTASGFAINVARGDNPLKKSPPRNCGTFALEVLDAGGKTGLRSSILQKVAATPSMLVRAIPSGRGVFGEKFVS